jgi:4-amino-4-deoxy-L-arabinose transferase-like glycosyltransferase
VKGSLVLTAIAPAAAFFAVHLLALLSLTATVYVAGRLVTRSLDAVGDSSWERFGIAVPLGLALFGQLGFCLGLFGMLTHGVLIAIVAGVHLAGWRVWREIARGAWRRSAIALGLLAAVAPLIVLAFYPPTAFDETLYHLPFARAFAASGGVPFLPDLRVPVFPQLSELVFTEVLLLADDVSVHCVELLAVLASAALLIGWGRRAAGPAAGWLAAGIWLGNPIVAYLAGTAYLEPGLALFGSAALYAQERWRESRSRGWLAVAAACAGSAAATKYLGLVFAGLVLLFVLFQGDATEGIAPRGRKILDLLVAVLVIAAVAAPWYLRVLYYTGNPVFPFFPGLFSPPTIWDAAWFPRRPLLEHLAGFVRIPWLVVFDRGATGSQPPHSPFYLLGLPLLAIAAWKDRRVRRLLFSVLVYSLLFLVLPPDARYLVAVLPLLSLALALAAGALMPSGLISEKRPRLTTALVLLVFLPGGWLYAGYRLFRQGPVPATAEARDRYLAAQLPLWPAVRFLNRTQGSRYTVYAFHAENMVYLAEGRFLGDWNGPGPFGEMEKLTHDPAALQRKLSELGAGFLMIVDGRGVALRYDDPEFRARFQRIYADGVTEVFALTPPAADGHRTQPTAAAAGPA